MFLNLFRFAEPFWPTIISAEPLSYTFKFCGTPLLHKKVMGSLLFTGVHCLKVFIHTLGNAIIIITQIPSKHIEKKWILKHWFFSNLAEPLDNPCGTLGFLGTPVEKHWSKLANLNSQNDHLIELTWPSLI